jgi:hypothetical protein
MNLGKPTCPRRLLQRLVRRAFGPGSMTGRHVGFDRDDAAPNLVPAELLAMQGR